MHHLPQAVLTLTSRYLSLRDTLCWLVYALEYHQNDLAHVLRYNCAYPLAHRQQEVVHTAVSHGCFHALAWLLSSPSEDPTELARQLRMRKKSGRFPAWVLAEAMERGADDKLIHWLATNCCNDAVSVIATAAQYKRLKLAQSLIDYVASHLQSSSIRVIVPFDEQVRVIHWVHLTRSTTDEAIIASSHFATEALGLAPVRHYRLYGDPLPPVYPAIDYAAACGDMELLLALHHDGRVEWGCTATAIDAAATRGDLEMVQWLKMNRTEGCSPVSMEGAVRNGHFLMVKWLYAMCQVTGTLPAFDNAAEHGHLAILKWLSFRFANFTCSTRALETTAANGHLEVLQWFDASHKKLIISPEMVMDAVNNGRMETLQWLVGELRLANRDPRQHVRPPYISWAAGTGNVKMLQWIHRELGMLPRDGLQYAVENADRAMIEWLLMVTESEDQRLFHRDALWTLASRGEWGLLRWILHSHRTLCIKCVFMPREKRLVKKTGVAHHTRDSNVVDPELIWLPAFTRLLLRLMPTVCVQEPRLPQWAAQHALADILHSLWQLHHPKVISQSVLKLLVQWSASTCSPIVQLIIDHHPEWITTSLVQWAATYTHIEFLELVLSHSQEQRRLATLRTVVWTACYHGNESVLQWVQRRLDTEPTSHDVWCGSIQVARRQGHDAIMGWLDADTPPPYKITEGISLRIEPLASIPALPM